jgi:hypothetical protein
MPYPLIQMNIGIMTSNGLVFDNPLDIDILRPSIVKDSKDSSIIKQYKELAKRHEKLKQQAHALAKAGHLKVRKKRREDVEFEISKMIETLKSDTGDRMYLYKDEISKLNA